MMNWVQAVFRKFAVFEGRAQRAEFWWFVLFCFLCQIVLAVIDGMLGTSRMAAGQGLLGMLFALGILIPSLAVGARRLHDTGRSGWWLLIGLIPILGTIVLIWFCVQDSQPGSNSYGANPKEGAPAAA
jgi:uncharacterized membrane protein YhaH (DUF805 family)